MRKRFVVAGIMFLGLVGLARPADVTVSKPGNGGTFPTVQEGVDAAGAGGTVTILDSELYVEDVTIYTTASGITVQAAAGQSPTIRAANIANRYPGVITSPADHGGVAVKAPCTIVGLNLENTDLEISSIVGMDFGSAAILIDSAGVTVRDCDISAADRPRPGVSSGLSILATDMTPSSATVERCNIHGGIAPVINHPIEWAIPGTAESFLTLKDCVVHHARESGVTAAPGETVLVDCEIHSNTEEGVWVGGGRAILRGCDIVDNGRDGLRLGWFPSAGPMNYPEATVTDCLIARNSGWNVRVNDGPLTIDRSIISQSAGSGGVWMGNQQQADAVLNMDFCDIYEPGKTCVQFALPEARGATAAITNSILVGTNGVICNADPSMTASVSFSNAWVTGTAYQDVATTNNVTIEPRYLDPSTGTRDDFRYYNDDLNVGTAGAEIGSQGPYVIQLDARSWWLYG